MAGHDFSKDHVDDWLRSVRALRTLLRRHTLAVIGAAGPTSATGATRKPGVPPRDSVPMTAVHESCRERYLPPLDALVVHQAGQPKGMPGVGYYKVTGLNDPLSQKTRPERAAAATCHRETEKRLCEEWGTRERRAGRRSITDGSA